MHDAGTKRIHGPDKGALVPLPGPYPLPTPAHQLRVAQTPVRQLERLGQLKGGRGAQWV